LRLAKRIADACENSIGTALLHGRIDVARIGSADWADYMHYGRFQFPTKNVPASE